jgi:hypothetical protein
MAFRFKMFAGVEIGALAESLELKLVYPENEITSGRALPYPDLQYGGSGYSKASPDGVTKLKSKQAVPCHTPISNTVDRGIAMHLLTV